MFLFNPLIYIQNIEVPSKLPDNQSDSNDSNDSSKPDTEEIEPMILLSNDFVDVYEEYSIVVLANSKNRLSYIRNNGTNDVTISFAPNVPNWILRAGFIFASPMGYTGDIHAASFGGSALVVAVFGVE